MSPPLNPGTFCGVKVARTDSMGSPYVYLYEGERTKWTRRNLVGNPIIGPPGLYRTELDKMCSPEQALENLFVNNLACFLGTTIMDTHLRSCRANKFTNPPNYSFVSHRLRKTVHDPSREPIVLVTCGSYSPITFLHLRMFEMAKDYILQNTSFEVMGGYLSPVSDRYKKLGLLNAYHRTNMCALAVETSSWLMMDPWEAFQNYKRTAIALDHFDHEINTVLGGVDTQDGEHRNVRIMLLAGSDSVNIMSDPTLWTAEDLEHILGRYGVFVIERAGSCMKQATDNLSRWRSNIHLVPQLIQNDVSSTKVRLLLRRGLSVHYLLPPAVVDYIEENNLYLDEESKLGKEKDV